MEYVLIQNINGNILVHEISGATMEDIVTSAAGLHVVEAQEMLIESNKAKLLHIILDETLKYPKAAMKPIEDESCLCVGCDNVLSPIRALLHYDMCSECDKIHSTSTTIGLETWS